MSDERDNEKKPERNFKPFPEQNEDGVDMSLIRANLKLTPTERIRRANHFRRQILWLRENAKRIPKK